MDIHRDGNLIEAGVWFAVGVLVFYRSFREHASVRRTLILLALTLVVFGISDLVETRTGAWWHPWWLFVWKALCVLGLLCLFTNYFRLLKRRKDQ